MSEKKAGLSMKTIAVAVGLMCVVVSVVSGVMTGSINSKINLLADDWQDSYLESLDKHSHLAELGTLLGYGGAIHQFKNMILRLEADKATQVSASFKRAQELLVKYKTYSLTLEEQQAVDAIEAMLGAYRQNVSAAEKMIRRGLSALDVDDRVRVSDTASLSALIALRDKVSTDLAIQDAKMQENLDRTATSANWVAIATSTLLIIPLLMVIFGYRQLKKQLGGDPQEILDLTNAVSNGQLTASNDGYSDRHTGVLAATDRTVGQLAKVVSRIREVSSAIDRNSASISDSTAALADKAEKQHENVSSATVVINKMSSTLKDNASNAETASTLANDAHHSARKGGEVVTKAVNAMTNINASSQKIADIIGVIDDIAFQTNLLALNAAVEAARAGENGRGFAVVATEVRNLAQRSATAAKEIKDLIEDSTGKVEDGTRLVNAAGETLSEIIGSVEAVNEVVAHMTQSNREQASAVDQVNSSIHEINSMRGASEVDTKQVVEGNRKLRESAIELAQAVDFFSLGGERGATEQRSSMGHNLENKISGDSWSGPERRSASRPWNDAGSEQQKGRGQAGASQQRVASGGSTDSWDSF